MVTRTPRTVTTAAPPRGISTAAWVPPDATFGGSGLRINLLMVCRICLVLLARARAVQEPPDEETDLLPVDVVGAVWVDVPELVLPVELELELGA
jgi:hypothetical protein